MQSLIQSKSAGVTGGRGTAGAGRGRDLLYAFDIVIGTDFLRRNPQVQMLSLQRPFSLHSVPLELSGQK